MDVMLELNDEQIDRVVNYYFSGSWVRSVISKFEETVQGLNSDAAT